GRVDRDDADLQLSRPPRARAAADGSAAVPLAAPHDQRAGAGGGRRTAPPGRPLVARGPSPSPPHTISEPGLVGGGNPPVPGEISLSHNGVLFLDELPEFNRRTLQVLRQPVA